MITFACPRCKQPLLLRPEQAARPCRCPHCHVVIALKQAGSVVAPALAPPGRTASIGDSRTEPEVHTAQSLGVPGYEIAEELGRGGMGVVYKAKHLALNRVVALKMILAGEHAAPEQRQRFLREAEAIARLRHPGIVRIHEIGSHSGYPFFALEYASAGSLDRYLGGRPLPGRHAAALGLQLARAVQHAHDHGVLHRDLKPANILVEEGPALAGDVLAVDGLPAVTLKVADFGLARLSDTEGQTRTGAVIGTPSYMPPEQVRGSKEVSPRADVYSLGAVLYELVTGRPPFQADTSMETMMQVLDSEPLPPRQLQPRLALDLETIILKCLDKNPNGRYATAGELGKDLERFLAGEPTAARPVGPMMRLGKWAWRQPTAAALVSVCILIMLALMASGVAYGWHEDAQRRKFWELTRTANQARDNADEIAEKERQTAVSEKQAREDAMVAERGILASHVQVRREFSLLALHRGVNLCENGDRDLAPNGDYRAGLLWLARALLTAPPGGPEERLARLNLAGWQQKQELVLRMSLDHQRVHAAAFSPDDKRVLTGSARRNSNGEYTAQVRDVSTGKLLAEMPHPHPISAVAWSHDGRFVATGCGAGMRYEWYKAGPGEARVWYADTGKPLTKALPHGRTIRGVAFNSEGTTLLTGSQDAHARLWDVSAEKELHKLKHDGPVTGVAFYPDGKTFLTAVENSKAQGNSGFVQLWDAETGKPLPEKAFRTAHIQALCLSPDGKALATGGGAPQLWHADPAQPAFGTRCGTMPNIGAWGSWGIAGSDEPRLVASNGQRWRVHLSNTATGRLVGQTLLMRGWGYTVALTRNGDTLLTSDGDTAMLWDVRIPQTPGVPMECKESVGNSAFSSDASRLAVTLPGNKVQLFDATTGKSLGPQMTDAGGVPSLVLGRDGVTIVTGGYDRRVRVWDGVTGKLRHDPPWQHPAEVDVVAISPDGGHVATGCRDGVVRIFDVATGKPSGQPLSHDRQVVAVAFSGDGRSVVIGTADFRVRRWELASGKVTGREVTMSGRPEALACSRDGRIALVGMSGDNSGRLVNFESGQPIGSPLPHRLGLWSVAFSSDETFVMTSSRDGTARLWDAASGVPVGPPVKHTGGVRGAVFGADGRSFSAVGLGSNPRVLKTQIPVAVEGNPTLIVNKTILRTGMYLLNDGVERTASGGYMNQIRDLIEKEERPANR